MTHQTPTREGYPDDARSITVDENAFPQTAQLQKQVEAKRAEGLKDIKFFARRRDDATVESFCGEVNSMLQAPRVTDSDLI